MSLRGVLEQRRLPDAGVSLEHHDGDMSGRCREPAVNDSQRRVAADQTRRRAGNLSRSTAAVTRHHARLP
jgi:hypothetical protein